MGAGGDVCFGNSVNSKYCRLLPRWWSNSIVKLLIGAEGRLAELAAD
jgi:hypothetical protein